MKAKIIALALGLSMLLFQATVYGGVIDNVFAQSDKVRLISLLKMVEVSSHQRDCLFSPRCRINFLTTMGNIPLDGAAGTASLITRTYRIPRGRLGAGKYLYEYVIDLSQAYGIISVPCVRSLSVNFGVPNKLDYDHNGIAEEQVFVVTEGPSGDVVPSSATRNFRNITFNFATPVCAGSSAGNGQISFPIGLVSSQAPRSINAVTKELDGPTHMVEARAPIFPQLHASLAQTSMENHSDPPVQGCGTDPVSSPNLLDCWLQKNMDIAPALSWQKSDGTGTIGWFEWDATRKAQLRQAFLDAWLWYQGGMTNFQGNPFQEPPTNLQPPDMNPHAHTVLGETEAWPRYLAEVAHSLAAEIGGWVPWSLKGYDNDSRQEILSAVSRYRYFEPTPDDPDNWYNVVYPGYLVWVQEVTPAHPVVAFSFLKQNNLIGSTRQETIANVLDWARWNLNHMIGPFTLENYDYHWHYAGLPPVSRILEGTLLTNPDYAAGNPYPKHWTAGCFGTTGLLRALLRTVNIPVSAIRGQETCGHTQPYFRSERLYLSHGDDPYQTHSKQTPVIPAQELLITQAVWEAWFPNAPDPCVNLGRRPAELLLQYLSNELADKYCSDVAAGSDHANGQVYQEFQGYYSVAELEAATLWGRLGQLAQNLGKCSPQ